MRDRNPDASAPPPQASGCPRQAGLYDCIWDAGSDDHAMSCGCHSEAVKNKVLVLEQHHAAGGLTQTFSRSGFCWNVGMHYLGDMGPGGGARQILD